MGQQTFYERATEQMNPERISAVMEGYPPFMMHKLLEVTGKDIITLTDLLIQYIRASEAEPGVQFKHDMSTSSAAERECESIFTQTTRRRFLQFNYKGEEWGEDMTHNRPDNIYWMLQDVVDGSKLLLDGRAGWSSCLAVAVDMHSMEPCNIPSWYKLPVAGLIYDPIQRYLYTGIGSFRRRKTNAFKYNLHTNERNPILARSTSSQKQRGNMEVELRFMYDDQRKYDQRWPLTAAMDSEFRSYGKVLRYTRRNNDGDVKMNIRTSPACNLCFADLAMGKLESLVLVGHEKYTDLDNYASGIALILASNGSVKVFKLDDFIFILASKYRTINRRIEEAVMAYAAQTQKIDIHNPANYSFNLHDGVVPKAQMENSPADFF